MKGFSRGLFAALFLYALTTSTNALAGNLRWRLVSVTPAGLSTEQTLHALGFEHLGFDNGAITVAATPFELVLIREAGLSATIIEDNYGAYLASRNDRAARLAETQDFAYGSMGGYFSPDEILGFVDSLRAAHGSSVIGDTSVIGESLEGRPVWMVELGSTGKADAPEVFLNSLIHAREGLSIMSMLYFIRYLADNYATADSVRWLLDNRRLYCVPVINPDGYEINWRKYDDDGEFGLWRKNARDNNANGGLDDQDGVDLNRNFSFKWGYDNYGSSATWSRSDFRGDSTFSEPETRVIRDFVAAHDFSVALNCHTYGNHLLKPWSYIAADTPDSATFNRLGERIVAGTGYGHGNATALLNYPANGEFTDWEYGDSAHGGIFAWTAEIGDKQFDFWPPLDQIEPIAESALPILFGAARAAGFWPRLELSGISEVDGSPRRLALNVNVDNAGLAGPGSTYILSLRGLGSRGKVVSAEEVAADAPFPLSGTVVVEFGPEVYELDAQLVVEQDGLAVTSVPVTMTRTTMDVSGDLNNSGRTDVFDLLALLRSLKIKDPGYEAPAGYDLNADGIVDIYDLVDLLGRLHSGR